MTRHFDIVIAGGGLAGLSLSILLAEKGWSVCLFEKESYPFHKVCGEYVSMESWDFLSSLGVPLENWHLPLIHKLKITAPDGAIVQAELPFGGFGISRYKLDGELAGIARSKNVTLLENTKVFDIHFEADLHRIETGNGLFTATVACACFGKKSNLDVKWKRRFLSKERKRNYVGVKYHVKARIPENQIELHNFSGGYCGISKIEDDRYCLCYLTDSANLKRYRQSIPEMEEEILKRNPFLRKLMNDSVMLYNEPLTISKISFAKKTQVENHVLYIGDAAGMITPLCGNGMSMALHGAKLAALSIQDYLSGQISREKMEEEYVRKWNSQFAGRLRTGRFVQRFFGHPFLSTILIRTLKPFPGLVRLLIRQTHGEKF